MWEEYDYCFKTKVEMDLGYLKKKGLQLIPSAMTFSEEEQTYKSDGTRVAFLNANATIKPGQGRGEVAERLRTKMLAAHDNGKLRVVPREDPGGNRLDLRRDVGAHFKRADDIFQSKKS